MGLRGPLSGLVLSWAVASAVANPPDPPPVCASDCMPEHCVGEKSWHCTRCVAERGLLLQEVQDKSLGNGEPYGRCITCASNCAPGKCVGEKSSQCTECDSTKLLVKRPGQDFGTCIQCANSCKEKMCVGERGDQCTACYPPHVLLDTANEKQLAQQLTGNANGTTNTSLPHGTCTRCATSCSPGKCTGPRSDQCTECPAERSFVSMGNTSYGTCVSCASNCLQGHCAGEKSWQCTKCDDSKILIEPTDGPDVGKGFGTCVSCAATCKPKQCIGSYANQCTACGEGRTLLKTPGKDYGECPADSVVSNDLLQQRLQEEHALVQQQRDELASFRAQKTKELRNQMDLKLSEASLASQAENEERAVLLGEGDDTLHEAEDMVKMLSPQ